MRRVIFLQVAKTIGLIILMTILVTLAPGSGHSQSATSSLSDYFGVVTLTKTQCVCLTFNNLGTGLLMAKLQFFDTGGKLIKAQEVEVAPGQASSLTYSPDAASWKHMPCKELRGVATASADTVMASDFISTMEILKGKTVQISMNPIRKAGMDAASVDAYIQRAKLAAEKAAAMVISAETAVQVARASVPRASAAANKAEAAAARAEDAAEKVCSKLS